MANDDDSALRRIGGLIGRAEEMIYRRDFAAAGALMERALGQTEELLADRPEDPELLRRSTTLRYDLANVYNYGGRAPMAVPLLAKAEQECVTLIAAGDTGAAALLADVLSRRAYSYQLLGAGASAVIYHDRAISLCRAQRRRGLMSDGTLGSFLALNARTLAEFGDVGLAMNSVHDSARLLVYLPESHQAAFHAQIVEAEDIVRTAIGLGANLFNALAAVDAADDVPQRVKDFADQVADTVRDAQKPDAEDRATTPSARVGLAHCADIGALLSDLALATVESSPGTSVFFAREAGYLLAMAWSSTLPAGNLTTVDAGFGVRHVEPWLEAIRICMDVCDEAGNTQLYSDFVTWLDTAAAVRDEYARGGTGSC